MKVFIFGDSLDAVVATVLAARGFCEIGEEISIVALATSASRKRMYRHLDQPIMVDLLPDTTTEQSLTGHLSRTFGNVVVQLPSAWEGLGSVRTSADVAIAVSGGSAAPVGSRLDINPAERAWRLYTAAGVRIPSGGRSLPVRLPALGSGAILSLLIDRHDTPVRLESIKLAAVLHVVAADPGAGRLDSTDFAEVVFGTLGTSDPIRRRRVCALAEAYDRLAQPTCVLMASAKAQPRRVLRPLARRSLLPFRLQQPTLRAQASGRA